MNSVIQYISEKIKNASWVVINPATEESQANLQNLTQAMYELIARLDFLPSVRWVAADLRTTVVWWTIAVNSGTINTVQTVGNQTSNWGFLTNPIVPSATNTNAVLSNINNIIIT